ncbi:ABC transporter substrate-binding protein [Atopobacter phocae]|uniref:ABC transporter substrate-binding protein n=1 Tax=Atopobacter phocae TaxID=136492 RepID=UPI00047212B5|nr:ABC transporter substrate-binding protein [Atopobacter phocae]
MKRASLYFMLLMGSVILLMGGKYLLSHSSQSFGSERLVIYNWGDYIDPELLKEFEKEYNYSVVYETFDSNEAMVTKIKQGGTQYDITVPSEYKIPEMIKDKLLLPLDHSKIKGMEHLDKQFVGMPFDPDNKWSLPYFWGTVGIVYNDLMVQEKDIQYWRDLWRPEFKNSILMIDGARETIGIGLQRRGYSLNETDSKILNQIANDLGDLMPNIKAILADEMKMYMSQNEAAIAITYSGEAVDMLDQNEHLHYVLPKEGSNIWTDNIVIPKTARNLKGAYDFINFMLRPDIAARNAEYIGYSTPNKEAFDLLPDDIKNDPQFYPSRELMEQMEVYKTLSPEKMNEYNDLFLEMKMK